MIQHNKNIRTNQSGFTLLEALVAFMILSIGMLGIASLQLVSLKAGHTAQLRTVAVIKAEEIMERIRNNQTALNAANITTTGYASSTTDLGQSFSCNDYAATTSCPSGEMARDDIFQWKASLRASLPDNAGTTASIVIAPSVPGVLPAATVTVTINWQERNSETQTMDDISYSVSSLICDNTSC